MMIRTLVLSVAAGVMLAGSNGMFPGLLIGEELGCDRLAPCDLQAVLDNHHHAYHPHTENTPDDFFRLASFAR
ncbi:hypothetical protein [Parazoarcus communis]|uniref:hypothetical protein n=1 Tax=Parazoarcus communis TaxID=41977 RepID=UPI001F46892B|nr:hypothetical protein [Parazoarcus communis]